VEAGWVPEKIWAFWRKERYFASTGIQTPDRPARNVVITTTTSAPFMSFTVISYHHPVAVSSSNLLLAFVNGP